MRLLQTVCLTLLIGVGIIVVGHVMSLGAEMAEEQSLTI